MAAKRKRTQLEILQRRATNKRSDLKKRGADPDNTPILPWSEVKKLDKNAKARYKRSLQRFTSTKMTVLKSGDVIETKILVDTNKFIRQYNKKADKERSRINKIDSDFGSIEKRLALKYNFDEKTGRYIGKDGIINGSITNVEIKEPPATARAAKQRLAAAKKMNNRTFAKRRKIAQDALIKMLRNVDMNPAADVVSSMTASQLDALMNRTSIFSILQGLGYDSDDPYHSFYINKSAEELIIYDSQVNKLIAKAATIGTKRNSKNIEIELNDFQKHERNR